MNICRLPSAFSARRLISAIRSFDPGGGRLLQNFCHSCSDARSAKDEDGITNGPFVTETIRPSKMEISQGVAPTSRRKLVVRYRPRRTRPSSSLTRCCSVSIISCPVLDPPAARAALPFGSHVQRNEAGVNRPGLKPGAYQCHVGRAGDQEADGQRELDTLAGGLEARSHGRKHPAILAVESRGFFFRAFTAR